MSSNESVGGGGRPPETPFRSVWYIIILTTVFCGIQIAWSVELAYISPYLLSLGLRKDKLSLVWTVGPLSGVIIQPVIGYLSDQASTRWGRRRPFIIAGCVASVLGFVGLGRTREIVNCIPGDRDHFRRWVIALAILSLVLLDVAINAMTATSRALLVDSVSAAQQEQCNVWGGRMHGLGNLIGYSFGYLNLPRMVPRLGHTQFQVLCLIAPAILVAATTVTCIVAKEKPAYQSQNETSHAIVPFMKGFLMIFFTLPSTIRLVCYTQFFAWISWFLFLIWNTTWTGEIYVEEYLRYHPPPPKYNEQWLWDDATRTASLALALNAVIFLITTILLPFFIANAIDPSKSPRFAISWLNLKRVWTMSHVVYAILMICTYFTTTVNGAILIVALLGIGWGLQNWAPFAIIASELALIAEGSDESDPLLHATQRKDKVSVGAIMGIHNIAVSAPQFVSTLIASGIFALLGGGRRGEGSASVGWVLRIGGVGSVVAAAISRAL